MTLEADLLNAKAEIRLLAEKASVWEFEYAMMAGDLARHLAERDQAVQLLDSWVLYIGLVKNVATRAADGIAPSPERLDYLSNRRDLLANQTRRFVEYVKNARCADHGVSAKEP